MMLAREYAVKMVCQDLDYPRSSYYAWLGQEGIRADEEEMRHSMEKVAQEWLTYGYRRITFQLRRQGWVVNSKRVRRLMKEMNLLRPLCERKKRTTNSVHPFPLYPNLVEGVKVERPEQVWVCDITYIKVRVGFVYLSVIMDVFTRSIRGWHLGRDLDGSLTLTALS